MPSCQRRLLLLGARCVLIVMQVEILLRHGIMQRTEIALYLIKVFVQNRRLEIVELHGFDAPPGLAYMLHRLAVIRQCRQ